MQERKLASFSKTRTWNPHLASASARRQPPNTPSYNCNSRLAVNGILAYDAHALAPPLLLACAICAPIYFPLVGEEEASCGSIFMYRNQRSLRRTWWRLFLTTLSSVDGVVRRWYAQCLISLPLQNSDTLRNFVSRSAAVLKQAPVNLQNKRSKLNARHISLVACARCSFVLCFPFGCS